GGVERIWNGSARAGLPRCGVRSASAQADRGRDTSGGAARFASRVAPICQSMGILRMKLASKVVISLYVSGNSASSQRALVNLRRICDHRIDAECEIRVIDVLESPNQAEQMRILATPTLIRESPLPARRVIGDLS